jgi:Domain of unknown function (DUF4279)
MTKTITTLISQELLNPTFAMTVEYLEEFKVDYKNGLPKIESIDFDKELERAIAYVKIKNESFYLTFYLDILNDQIEISFVDTTPLFVVSFSTTSEKHSLTDLLSLTIIKPTETIRKGDKLNRDIDCDYNGLCFDSYKKPGLLIDKISYLLDILETDKKGVKNLIKLTKCNSIWLTIVYYNGYGTFSDLSIPKKIIKRLSSLGLELIFDIYAKPYARQTK